MLRRSLQRLHGHDDWVPIAIAFEHEEPAPWSGVIRVDRDPYVLAGVIGPCAGAVVLVEIVGNVFVGDGEQRLALAACAAGLGGDDLIDDMGVVPVSPFRSVCS